MHLPVEAQLAQIFQRILLDHERASRSRYRPLSTNGACRAMATCPMRPSTTTAATATFTSWSARDRRADRFAGHQSLIDRVLSGEIAPPDLGTVLQYFGLSAEEQGQDADNYAWAFNGNGTKG